MEKAILLAVAASFCTATASVAQRQGARSVQTTDGFDVRLILRLARRPVWLLGIASMIAGFLFQLTALRYGALALVQPILALELLLVFGYMAVAGRRRVRIKRRDWLAAAAMSAGIAVFLRLASPSGGRLHAPGASWLLAGLITLGAVLVAAAAASGRGHRPGASSTRRAALLGSATGLAWGFVAAVIKELSSHLGGGIGAVFTTWSLYLLLVVGAAAMLLASHALAAGPLAASQPGFTILDPLWAGLLGVFLFSEHIRTGPWDLAGEALALALVVAGASGLSRSCFILGEFGDPSCLPAGFQARARGKRIPDAARLGPSPVQQRKSELSRAVSRSARAGVRDTCGMDERAPADGIRYHRGLIAPLSDDELVARIESVEPLPDADDDDPAWLEDATWDRAEFLLAAADAIGERRLLRAIAPVFQRAALGEGYEMMQGLRHGPERAVLPDEHLLTAIMRPLTRDQRAGCRRWAVRELGILRDPQALDDLVSALGDDQPLVRSEACMSLGMLDQAAPLIRRRVRAALRDTAERDLSSEVRRDAQWAIDSIA